MIKANDTIESLKKGDQKSLARAITILENELTGYDDLLVALAPDSSVPIIGVTGPPGAGKSTLINSLLKHFTSLKKKIAVVAVDPTSPFNYGSLLGDRLRFSEYFNDENVFIRSLASRGSLGGLSEKIIEITDLLRMADFDFVFVETVGVGQSEVEIAGLADITLVVFVPESGDDIQAMKSGIMEIADIYVVNKSDREGSDRFAANLSQLLKTKKGTEKTYPVIQTSALNRVGIEELANQLEKHKSVGIENEKKIFLLTEKAYRLLQRERMKDVNKIFIRNLIQKQYQGSGFNLYRFVKSIDQAPIN